MVFPIPPDVVRRRIEPSDRVGAVADVHTEEMDLRVLGR
jgi:hypothetical protein